jgi:fatty-acyl-CoA synthase
MALAPGMPPSRACPRDTVAPVQRTGEETAVLEGLMQHDFPLSLQHVLWRLRTLNAGGEVVELLEEGASRITYGELALRVDRLCNALAALGVRPGDRVATFAWNTQRHLELYLAVPCMGAVLHTLNIRLFPEQLTYIVNHARDRLIFVDPSLTDTLEPIAPTFETVERTIVMDDEYDDLLADQPAAFDYPEIDERQAGGLCYTSGSTGASTGRPSGCRSSRSCSRGRRPAARRSRGSRRPRAGPRGGRRTRRP